VRNTTIRFAILAASISLGAAVVSTEEAARTPQVAAAAEPTAPADLRGLLARRQSELRLVQTRYTLDRAALSANYLGGMRTQAGGRGGSPAGAASATGVAAPPALSPARMSRLARFDLDWQAALARIDRARLTPEGRTDLDALSRTAADNLAALDRDARGLATISPLVPFAPDLVALVEARIRLQDIDAEKVAGTLAAATREIARATPLVEAAAAGRGGEAMCAGKDAALGAAAGIEALRAALAEWFQFYNGYDPLFTWWVGLPNKRLDTALQAYAGVLRDRLALAGLADRPVPASHVQPAVPPRFPSVPDLAELMALSQDEMTPIVQQFRTALSPRAGGRGGAGAPGEAAGAPSRQAPGRAFFEGWLAALKTLDFDSLSRNAKVDYLFIRDVATRRIARVGSVLPANPPRKPDSSGIPGAARGRDGLVADLEDEFIPYIPEQLVAIGERELAWCEAEMKKASRQMGLGDDWKAALERVKGMHPPPGGQVRVVRDLMFEAVDYLRARDLVTVPSVAAESLRMIMMTPERQLVNPFFTGGTLISVAYPTDTMEYDARIQSMRGNNTPFSHATAFHEMIPGHNLVFYANARFAAYRPSLAGDSPFYSEGWPLYWELQFYDLGFDDTPEKRVGALFWRMHRCARIVFSMKFHLGEWSPQECIDYLVDRVGFERDNATAEVRRSFQGGYGPLYQAAYLLGGLQLRALRREIVDGRQMPLKAFHDEALRQGNMPIALLRLAMGRQVLTRDTSLEWKFLGEVSPARR
jgi:hypothetical protein